MINNHAYIGKTERTCDIRWKEHIRAINDETKKSLIHLAFQKYGVENFSFEVLEENIPIDELNKKEKEYIKKYNTFIDGYNCTIGGDGESHVNHDLIIDLYNRGYSYNNIHYLTGYALKTIRTHINGDAISVKRAIITHAIGRDINNGKSVKYNNIMFDSHKELADYLAENEPLFKDTRHVSIMSYISMHSKNGVFELPKNNSKSGVVGRVYDVNCKSISFNGIKYNSYKDLALFLIENDLKFKDCKVNTVIQGISYSIKKEKPYKGYCFYSKKKIA